MWYAVAGIIIVIGVAIAAVLVYRRHQKPIDDVVDKATTVVEDIKKKV